MADGRPDSKRPRVGSGAGPWSSSNGHGQDHDHEHGRGHYPLPQRSLPHLTTSTSTSSSQPSSPYPLGLPHPPPPPSFTRPETTQPMTSEIHNPHLAHQQQQHQQHQHHLRLHQQQQQHAADDRPRHEHDLPSPIHDVSRRVSAPTHGYQSVSQPPSRDHIVKRDPAEEHGPGLAPSMRSLSTGAVADGHHGPSLPPPPPPPAPLPPQSMQQQQHQHQQHQQPQYPQQQPQQQQQPQYQDEQRLPPFMQSYDGGHGGQPLSAGPSSHQFRPPTSPFGQAPSPMHLSMPVYGQQPVYAAPASSLLDPTYGGYTSPGQNGSKRKAARAAQACNSCRSLKAKCDEEKPCSSCREKKLECTYREAPQKQGDKVQSDMLGMLRAIMTDVGKVKSDMGGLAMAVQKNDTRLTAFLRSKSAGADVVMKEDREDEPVLGIDSTLPEAGQAELEPEDHYSPTDSYRPTSASAQTNEEEDEGGDVEPLRDSAMPVNHTTGASRLIRLPAISKMLSGMHGMEKISERYPIIQEEKRGYIRLYGIGEGLEKTSGYDKDPSMDHESEVDEVFSDASGSPSAEALYGNIDMTPLSGVETRRPADEMVGGMGSEGTLDLSPATVYRLAERYMKDMNIMHPIFSEMRLRKLLKEFLKSVSFTTDGGIPKDRFYKKFISPGSGNAYEGVGVKRPRSPEPNESVNAYSVKQRGPPANLTTALVLLIMALGKICECKGRIPDVAREAHLVGPAFSPHLKTNGTPGSPAQHSPPSVSSQSSRRSSPLQSVDHGFQNRKTSLESYHKHLTGARNIDIIPGLAYFTMGNRILSDFFGANNLQAVHGHILASLYYGQLVRPLESHSHVHAAGRGLQHILRPITESQGKLVAEAADNPILFAFWTCLQLESDILAELPCAHSNILTFESIMPYPNLVAAVDLDKIDQRITGSYQTQLFLRKHLNMLATEFYKPPPPGVIIDANAEREYLERVKSTETVLDSIISLAPHYKWVEGDTPVRNDILAARVRAKFYGAQVITYRPFVQRILDRNSSSAEDGSQLFGRLPHGMHYDRAGPGSSGAGNSGGNAGSMMEDDNGDINQVYLDYAKKGIWALIHSTEAFHGMTEGRLIITNPFGTSHAQWGNCLVLQAALQDPVLRGFIDQQHLRRLLNKTIEFLENITQPSSALATDLKILKHVRDQMRKRSVGGSGGGGGSGEARGLSGTGTFNSSFESRTDADEQQHTLVRGEHEAGGVPNGI